MKGLIGVYGTWRVQEDSPMYRLAMEIGRVAAQRGFIVLSGAYSGIMEAAPRGAQQAGGMTVGYSWSKLNNELTPNPFLDRVVVFSTIEQRMARIVGDPDICVFFPGRTGTAAELALATEMRAKGVKTLPLVIMGDYWGGFFSWLKESNAALDLPSDGHDSTELYVRVNSADEFVIFLETYEHPGG